MNRSADIDAACATIRKGGVIAYPTEAVYGIGCDPQSRTAVSRIAEIKGRDVAKRFILIASQTEQLEPFCDMTNPDHLTRAQATWPGPHTWIFPAADTCPEWLCGERAPATIAVRITDHPLVIALCDACNSALTSTSANYSGERPLSNAAAVEAQLGEALDYILVGETGGLQRPTSIHDAATGAVIRE